MFNYYYKNSFLGRLQWYKLSITMLNTSYKTSLSIFRKLVGLLAQTLCLAEKMKIERISPESELNLYKNQMARCIANNLFEEKISDK